MFCLLPARAARPRSLIQPVAEVLEARMMLTAGQPDPTFNQGLPLTVPLTFQDYQTFGMLPELTLKDGKILLVSIGLAPPAPANVTTPLLIRLNPDGAFDTTFGQGGYLPITGPGYVAGFMIRRVVLQPDDKIVLQGSTPDTPANSVVIQRLNRDGSPDTSFGASGSVVVSTKIASASLFSHVFSMDITSSSKILLTIRDEFPFAPNGASFVSGLLRLKSDGAIDTSFGPNGDGRFAYTPGVTFRALATDGDATVVGVSGDSILDPRPGLLRITPEGAPDPSFGTDGRVAFPSTLYATGLIVDGTGRVISVVGGQKSSVMRYLRNGTLDTSFGPAGSGGVSTLPLSPATSPFGISQQVLQPDGTILVVGNTLPSGDPNTSRVALARTTADGILDTAYGVNGIAATNLPALQYTMTLDGQGHFRVLTFAGIGETLNWNAVVRQYDTFDRPIVPPIVPPVPPDPPVPPPDTTPPTVQKFSGYVQDGRLVKLTIRFSEPMNARRASSRGAYRLISAGHDQTFGTKDDVTVAIRSTHYRASRRVTTLVLSEAVKSDQAFKFVAKGARLTDLSGNPLAGKKGVPGSNFLVYFGRPRK